ncbi:DNA double-strand break repair helicase HerA [Sulfuracidifex tepidarius]|uniref:DNA double-strand break repair helicase HerA n=2 Tax=Sulfuracidifex tepidarius TaxID=1294262 RepID=A0A510DZW8_9CREN|nr:DNA double-strand break repair helicase HerA [Sulfuracidifex tepidarius]
MIEQARERASKNGEVVGLASRVIPLTHGDEEKEIRAEIPFETYLKKRFLVGSYLGISLPVSGTLILSRITAVERSDILALSKVPALTPVEDPSGMTTSLAVNLELLSEEVDGEVVPPSSPVDPQSPIFIPSTDFVKRMLGIPDQGVEIGKVMEGYKEMDVPVKLTHDITRHHVLVVGTTGAGKTNLLRVLLKRSQTPAVVFDIQGDYVKTAARIGGNVVLPLPREYATKVTDFVNLFLKRSNLKGSIKDVQDGKFIIEGEEGEFFLYLTGFQLRKTYNFLPEVSPFFTLQGAKFFKSISEECLSTVDKWEEECSELMDEMRIHKTTQDNIIRSVNLLKNTGVIDVKFKDSKSLLDEPKYEEIMNGKTVVDLRWALERGVSTATMSAFIIAQRIFEIVDKRYKSEGEETPYLMIFDEAHEYFPQSRKDDEKEGLERLINRIMRLGRVRGIGTILATHRPTDLNDLILTLANTKVVMRADEDALKKIGMEEFSSMLQASPAGYSIMRTFSLKVHDLIFRTVKDS